MKTKIFLFVMSMSLVLFSTNLYAGVPQMISYQGKITKTSGLLIDTTVAMTFSIYADPLGMPPSLWGETQDSVKVEKGVFSVLLGSANPIPDSVFDGGIRYLAVKVGDDPVMTPLKPIVSVAYAYTDGDWIIDGDNLYRTQGNVGIGTMNPEAKLDIHSSGTDVALRLSRENTDWYVGIDYDQSDKLKIGAGNNPGQSDKLTIDRANGNVGIGTTNPDAKLTVNGNAHITGNLTVDGAISPFPLKVYDSGWFAVAVNSTYTKAHALGTNKLLVNIYYSNTSDGSGDVLTINSGAAPNASLSNNKQLAIVDVDSSNIVVRTGPQIVEYVDSVGNWQLKNSGYCRIIALALE